MGIRRIVESAPTARVDRFRLVRRDETDDVSLLEDFARIRLYRNCASRYELLAERELLPEVRVRYRVIARHYRDLADREEQSDKARIAKHLALLRQKRRQAD